MTYRWSSITPPDTDAWSALSNHLATVDGTEEFYSAQDLAEELDSAALEPEYDTWAVWAGAQMVGFGQLWVSENPDADGRVRCSLVGGVHSAHRRRGLGRALMDKLEARADEAVAQRHPGHDHFWQAGGGLHGSAAQAMLTRRGYAVVRYFNLLTRPLPGASLADDGGLPRVPGVTFRTATDDDKAAVLAAHRLAFTDHWGVTPPTDRWWDRYWTGSSQRFAVSTLAVDDHGQVLSYVLGGQWVDRELYISLVATRPDQRGRGLARAALVHTLDRATRSGDYDVAELEVDSQSLTGATRLYDRVGFTRKHTTSAMRREPGTVERTL